MCLGEKEKEKKKNTKTHQESNSLPHERVRRGEVGAPGDKRFSSPASQHQGMLTQWTGTEPPLPPASGSLWLNERINFPTWEEVWTLLLLKARETSLLHSCLQQGSEVGVNISDFPLGVCSPRRDLQSGLIPITTTRPSAPQLCLCRAAKSPGCQQLPESLPEAKLVSESKDRSRNVTPTKRPLLLPMCWHQLHGNGCGFISRLHTSRLRT